MCNNWGRRGKHVRRAARVLVKDRDARPFRDFFRVTDGNPTCILSGASPRPAVTVPGVEEIVTLRYPASKNRVPGVEEIVFISHICAREQLLRPPLASSSLRGLSSRAASSRASLHSALLQRGVLTNERPPQARRAPSRPPLHAARWSSALAARCCSAPARAPQHSAVEEHRHCSYVYHARISLAQA